MGPALVRVAVAAVFLAHGAQKILAPWGGLAAAPALTAYPELGPIAVSGLGLVELVCGTLLLAGAFTRWVAPVLALDRLLLAWPLRVANGFFLDQAAAPGRRGYEYDLVLIVVLVSFVISGGGAWSVDGLRRRSRETAAAGRARIRAGRV